MRRLSVPELLAQGADLFAERNAIYGDSFESFGAIMLAMFPEGLTLESASDWNRFGVLFHIVSKTQRYAVNLRLGGHHDSARDIKVLGAILESLTRSPDESPTEEERRRARKRPASRPVGARSAPEG